MRYLLPVLHLKNVVCCGTCIFFEVIDTDSICTCCTFIVMHTEKDNKACDFYYQKGKQ